MDETLTSRQEALTQKILASVHNMITEKKYTPDYVDETIKSLRSLQDIIDQDLYKCPISKQIMKDPVLLKNGVTYDRKSIEDWLHQGNVTCYHTKQILEHTSFVPNHQVKEIISSYCDENSIELVKDEEEVVINDDEKLRFGGIIQNLFASFARIQESGELFDRFTKGHLSSLDRDICLNTMMFEHLKVIKAIVKNFRNDKDKIYLVENTEIIGVLIPWLDNADIVIRRDACETICCLSTPDSNKFLLGRSGAIEAMVRLMKCKDVYIKLNCCKTLLNLCFVIENVSKAVEAGVVLSLIESIYFLPDDLYVSLLYKLVRYPKAKKEMNTSGVIRSLLYALKSGGLCHINIGYALMILIALLKEDASKVTDIGDDDKKLLRAIAETGNKESATMLLGMLDEVAGYVR